MGKVCDNSSWDVTVVGGGLAGASFARAISGAGLRTLVLDHLAQDTLYTNELDNRGLAISYTSKQILQQLACWDYFVSRAFPIETVHVSEQGSFGFTKLAASTYKIAALGYVISASHLGYGLINGISALPDITELRPARLNNLVFNAEANNWHMQLEDRVINTKLIVAADGSDSCVRKWQNIPITTKDYDQSAIVTNIQIQAKQISVAYERFTMYGVLAILPFSANLAKCVWTIDNQHLAKFKQMSDNEFLQNLQAAFGFRLGKFVAVHPRKIFPIRQMYAENIARQNLFLIGNAANTLHPVAAQGFNLGLRDAVVLANILRAAKQDGKDITSNEIMQNYSVARKDDHANTRQFTNRLVNIFASLNPTVKFSRRAGLVLANFIPQINKKIITQGLGAWM